jgi:hypothetical protein
MMDRGISYRELLAVRPLPALLTATCLSRLSGRIVSLAIALYAVGKVFLFGVATQVQERQYGDRIWADRFEGTLDDIFALQDRWPPASLARSRPNSSGRKIERAKRKPTESLDAYDYYLSGMANLHQGTRQAIDEALPLFYKAMEFDPSFASAYAMAAWCHFWRKINGWMSDRAREIAKGARLARRAVELGRGDAVALTRSGHALGHLVGDLDGGVALIERAKVLNPNLAAAWFLGGFLKVRRGEPDKAIEHFTHAMRLSPLDSEMFRMQSGIALAHIYAGRLDGASSWAEKSVRELPSFLFAASIVAASHAPAGRTEEARRAVRDLRALDPALRISNLKDWVPIHRPENRAAFADGLGRAGLPE